MLCQLDGTIPCFPDQRGAYYHGRGRAGYSAFPSQLIGGAFCQRPLIFFSIAAFPAVSVNILCITAEMSSQKSSRTNKAASTVVPFAVFSILRRCGRSRAQRCVIRIARPVPRTVPQRSSLHGRDNAVYFRVRLLKASPGPRSGTSYPCIQPYASAGLVGSG